MRIHSSQCQNILLDDIQDIQKGELQLFKLKIN